MTAQLKSIWIIVNTVLTTINGFIFGILGGFSPLHVNRKEPVKIPVYLNLLLAFLLVFILVAEIRVNF